MMLSFNKAVLLNKQQQQKTHKNKTKKNNNKETKCRQLFYLDPNVEKKLGLGFTVLLLNSSLFYEK